MQNEITTAGALLDERGALSQRGYAKRLILEYDRRRIKANALRIKEWDYYLVLCDDHAMALTVADNSYMGLVSASLIVFGDKPWEQTTSIMSFMPMGSTEMPSSSERGDVNYVGKHCRFSFLRGEHDRKLSCHIDRFKDGKPFDCELELTCPDDESMVIATPFAGKERAFYYNQKINCMPARGKAEFDGRVYEFREGSSFGTLDWGRGVWTYKNTWYWGSASGMAGGERFGFNLGYGFGDTSSASENMLFYGGRAHKLEDVSFNIPQKNGADDFMSPWTFTSSDGRFSADFVPIIDRASRTSAAVIESDQHQVFGRFSGKAVLDSGEVVEFKNLTGFAEKVKNRW